MKSNTNTALQFIRNWTLPISILTGMLAYLLYANCPLFDATRPWAEPTVAIVQPVLIFSMLFLSFCKIDCRTLRFRLSHLWLLLFQCGTFALISLAIHFCHPSEGVSVALQGALLCLICPTATAATVVTQKLKGDAADVTMYTLLINLAVSVLVPLFVPLIREQHDMQFWQAFQCILAKVFPLLICPLLAAQVVRFSLPALHRKLLSFPGLAFYLWAVSLSIAIAVTTRSIVHTTHPPIELGGIALASLLCCILQFWLGHAIGQHCNRLVSTSQALGQKNTVFAIWMGYTFLNPVTSLAGGFYSIWHNLYNTWQLRKQRKQELDMER